MNIPRRDGNTPRPNRKHNRGHRMHKKSKAEKRAKQLHRH